MSQPVHYLCDVEINRLKEERDGLKDEVDRLSFKLSEFRDERDVLREQLEEALRTIRALPLVSNPKEVAEKYIKEYIQNFGSPPADSERGPAVVHQQPGVNDGPPASQFVQDIARNTAAVREITEKYDWLNRASNEEDPR